MKAIHLLIATLIMMSLASCTAESSDPVDNSSSTYFLERTYGARSVTYEENNSDNLNLNDLPAISLKEADEILSNLRKHTNAKEEHNVLAADKGNQTLLKVITSQTINVSTPLQFSSTLPAMPTVTYITTDIMLNAVLHS